MHDNRLYKTIVFFGCIIALTGLLTTGYWLILKPNVLVGQKPKLFIIHANTHFADLHHSLHEAGYLSHDTSFYWLARLLKYDKRILSGAYQLWPNMSNWELIRLLKSGRQTPVKLVLDHAYTKTDLIRKMSEHTSMHIADLTSLLQDSGFVAQWGFTTDNILTLFIPNTYEVYWNSTPQEFFQRMHREYQRFWNEKRKQQAKKLKLTPVEVSILASIVQKETNKLAEIPIIAGIYLNRLRKGMRLQACPTLLYAAGETSAKRVLKKYHKIASPYNTYLHKGLPPGPISIPSIAIIDAVLNAQQHKYLYFSAKEDFSGYHYFAKDFEEHKKNSEKYRRALNKARIYK